MTLYTSWDEYIMAPPPHMRSLP